MSMVDEVSAQLKDAMRAKDKARVSALRNIRARFIEAMKSGQGDGSISDDEAQAILRSLAKQRAESIAAYRDGGRDDLVQAEQAELAIIEEFLPTLADEATTAGWVDEAIAQTNASGPGDLGKVMGALMRNHKGLIDGKLANRLARERLS